MRKRNHNKPDVLDFDLIYKGWYEYRKQFPATFSEQYLTTLRNTYFSGAARTYALILDAAADPDPHTTVTQSWLPSPLNWRHTRPLAREQISLRIRQSNRL